MPRRRDVPKREVIPDSVYNSPLVAKFVSNLMTRGKKGIAEQTFYRALAAIEERAGEDPMQVFKKALDNVKPMLETKPRRVGGSTYQVPIEVGSRRRTSLGIRWVIGYARRRGEKTMVDRLANELLDASNNRGAAVRKRQDVHRMADANKAFAHYRW